MNILIYLIYFLVIFIIIYLLYYFLVVSSQIKVAKGKANKKKNLPSDVLLLRDYYKINIDKIGLIRVLRILNFVNALFLSLLVLVIVPLDKVYIKILLLLVLMFPTIWFVYYFLAKYLKHLERKED